MDLTSLFNLKGLAIALGIGFAAGLASGYFLAVGQFEKAALAAAPIAAKAQHTQDVKQHGDAVKASGQADKQSAGTVKATGEQVRVIHDRPTIFVNPPPACPADPVVDPAVLAAYNKAGH